MAPVREASVRVVDVGECFSPPQIGSSLAALWTARGCQLEPTLGSTGEPYLCPLTGETLTNPVMLGDGRICEEAAALKSIQVGSQVIMRLDPLRGIIESFLQSSNVGYSPSEQLEQAMGEAEMPGTPWQKRLRGLETCIAQSKCEMDAITSRLVEAARLLDKLQMESAAVKERCATQLQAAVRAHQSRARVRTLREAQGLTTTPSETAAVCLQRWWRRMQRKEVSTRKAKPSRNRHRRKTSGRAPCDSPGSLRSQGIGNVQKLKGTIQQYAKVQERGKRSLLDFFLNQLGYDVKQHRCLIFTSDEQRAIGLRNALKMSPSVDFPLHLIERDDEEYGVFKGLARGAGIITPSVFDTNIDVTYANMVINYDMPAGADDYCSRLMRAGDGAKAMSFPTSDADMEIVREVERRLEMKFRDIQGVAKLKSDENRKALRRKLASAGNQKQRAT